MLLAAAPHGPRVAFVSISMAQSLPTTRASSRKDPNDGCPPSGFNRCALITVSPEEVPGPHWPEAKKRPLLDLSRSGLIRGRKQTSPVCQRIGTPEKSAIELWPELTHRGSVSK
ncbi:hypothetical protein ACVWZL_009048 [Bradyrhizobium sp. GM2.4]